MKFALTYKHEGVVSTSVVEAADNREAKERLYAMLGVTRLIGVRTETHETYLREQYEREEAAKLDRELALALWQGELEWIEMDEEEAMILAESEICARLDIPLDETEQGLTKVAVAIIELFMREHLPADELVERDLAKIRGDTTTGGSDG